MTLIDGGTVWRLHATHGFPVGLSIPVLADRGIFPTWDTPIDAARDDGVDVPRLIRRLTDIAGDAYPPDVATGVRERLTLLCRRYVMATHG